MSPVSTKPYKSQKLPGPYPGPCPGPCPGLTIFIIGADKIRYVGKIPTFSGKNQYHCKKNIFDALAGFDPPPG
jgi:hypothetical protein